LTRHLALYRFRHFVSLFILMFRRTEPPSRIGHARGKRRHAMCPSQQGAPSQGLCRLLISKGPVSDSFFLWQLVLAGICISSFRRWVLVCWFLCGITVQELFCTAVTWEIWSDVSDFVRFTSFQDRASELYRPHSKVCTVKARIPEWPWGPELSQCGSAHA